MRIFTHCLFYPASLTLVSEVGFVSERDKAEDYSFDKLGRKKNKVKKWAPVNWLFSFILVFFALTSFAQDQFGGKVAVLDPSNTTTWYNATSQTCDGAGIGNLTNGNPTALNAYLGDKFYLGGNVLTYGFGSTGDKGELNWRYYLVGGSAPAWNGWFTLPYANNTVCGGGTNKKYEFAPVSGTNMIQTTAIGNYRLDIDLRGNNNGPTYTVYTSGNYIPFTVNALGDPSSQTASAANSSSINLTWVQWSGRNVMIVRKKAGDSWTEPTQGTAYTVGTTIGSGTVVYNSNGTSYTNTGLLPATGYDYKFYSENWSYYSPGSIATATTSTSSASDYFRSRITGNWNVASNWESSPDNFTWVTSTLVPDENATATTILNPHTITLTAAAGAKALTINLGGSLVCANYTLTFTTNGTLTNNGTFTYGTGTVAFKGGGFVSGTIGFNNVTLLSGFTGGVNFGTTSTLYGILQINAGTYVDIHAPTYTSTSTLQYNAGGVFPYDRRVEWSTASGNGYPYNVQVSNNTTLNAGGNSGSFTGTALSIAGNLTVDVGSSLNMASGGYNMTLPLVVAGNLSLAGNLTLSGVAGGDIKIGGNWTRTLATGTFTSNGRAAWFNGTTAQTISITGSGTQVFSYLIIDNPANVSLSNTAGALTDVSVDGNNTGLGDQLQLLNNGALDLNGRTVYLAGIAGGNILVSGGARHITGIAGSRLAIQSSKTVTSASVGTLITDVNVLVTVDKGLAASSTYNVGSGLTTINGTLELDNGYIIANSPAYGPLSLLKYNSGSTPPRGPEWMTSSGFGYPNDVQISNNTTFDPGGNIMTGTVLNLARDLTIDAGSNFKMDNAGHNMTVPLFVGRNLSLAGNLSLSGLAPGDIKVGGNWTHTTGIFTPNLRAVFFNGASGNQTITSTGSEIFDYVLVDKAAGNVLLANDATINQLLTLTSGSIVLGSNNLTLGAASPPVAGTLNASNMIVADGTGQLRKIFTGTGLYVFPVGDLTGTADYSPVTLEFTSGTYAANAYAAVRVTNLKHPNNFSAANYLTRYWTISSSGITGLLCNVTGTFVAADIVGVITSMATGKWTGTKPWVKYGSVSTSTISASGVSSFGDFTGISLAPPLVSITADPSLSVCQGAALTLTASPEGDPDFTYLWSTGATTQAIVPPTGSVGTTTYTVTVTDANGLTASSSVSVVVNTPPTASITGSTQYCAGGTIALTGQPDGMSAYSWTGPNGFTTSATSATITENFNTLASSGTSSVVPSGWAFYETGQNANTSYTAGNGSDNTGDTYSYGTDGDRAFGMLRSNKLVPYIGAAFTNGTGQVIRTINITYTGEQWRLGSLGRTDKLQFQYSLDAPNIYTGTWNDVNALDFTAPVTTGTVGWLDGNASGNHTTVSGTINGLSIAAGATFRIRFYDFDASLADDGLAIDDFSITYGTGSTQTITRAPATIDMSGPYTVTVTNSTGCISQATVNVTVNPLPVPNPASSGSACLDERLDLTAASIDNGETYTWSGPNGFNSTFQNPSISPVVAATAGVYSVTVTDAKNCSASASIIIAVYAKPDPATITSNSPVCAGSTINLYGHPDGEVAYNWTGPNVWSSVSYTKTFPLETFNSLVSSGNGTSAVMPNYSDSKGSYSWTFLESGSNGNTAYTANTGSLGTGDTYSYGSTGSPDRAFGELSSGTETSAIGAKYTNNSGNTIQTVSITYTGEQWRYGGGGRITQDQLSFWYKVSAGSLTTNSDPSLSGWASETMLDFKSLYYPGLSAAQALDGNNSSYRQTITKTITGLNIPNGSEFWIEWLGSNITGNDDGLAIDDVTLTWSTGSIQNPTISSSTTAMSGTYNLTATNSNGCVVTATSNVTVNPTSVGGSATPVSPICYNTTSTITLTGYTGTIQWQQSADGSTGWANVTGGSGATSATYTTSNLTVTTYYRAMVTSGACAPAYSNTVTINITPTASAGTVTGKTPLCAGETATFTANLAVLSGGTGTWSSSNNAIATVDALGVVTGVTAGSCNIIYTITGGCGGPVSALQSVTINAIPAFINTFPATICSGSALIFDASTTPAYNTSTWTSAAVTGITGHATSGTGSINETLINTTLTQLPVTYNYTVTANGCTKTESFTATVVKVVVDQVYSNPAPGVCPGMPFDLHSNTNLPGFPQPAVLLNENFESGTAGSTTGPNGWTTTVTGTDVSSRWTIRSSLPSGWSTRNVPLPYLPVTINSNTNDLFYLADNTPGLNVTSTSLISPASGINTTGYTTLTLDFWNYYRDKDKTALPLDHDYAYIDVSTDGGTNWTTVKIFDENHGLPYSFAHETVNLSAYINQANVRIRFRFEPTQDYYWAIDNIKVSGTSPITGFAWTSIPAGYSNTLDVSPTGLTQAATTQYIATYTDLSSTCSASGSVTVQSYPSPAKPVISPSGNVTICTNNSVTLSVTSGSAPYLWNQNGSPLPTETGTSYITPVFIYTGSSAFLTNVSVTASDANGCSATSNPTYIYVYPVIGNNTISTDQAICTATIPSPLTGSTPTGGYSPFYNYLWESSTTSAGAGFAPASGTNNTIGYTPGALTQTTWYRRTVTSNGCSDVSATIVQITVTPATVAGTASASASPVCSGSSTTVALSGYTGSIQWQQSANGSTGWVNVTGGMGATTATYTTPNLSSTTYYRAAVTSGVCSSANSGTVLVTVVSNIWIGNSPNWEVGGNWSCGVPPTAITDVIIPNVLQPFVLPVIGSTITADCKNIEIQSGATVSVKSDAASSGSLIANGSSTGTGNVEYTRDLRKDRWYIVSAPVKDNSTNLENSAVAYDPISGTYSFGPYTESNNDGWAYPAILPSPVSLDNGKGYILKTTEFETLVFSGKLNDDFQVSLPSSGQDNGWNAVGNPYTSALRVKDINNTPNPGTDGFLDVNFGVLESNYAAIYIWDDPSKKYRIINRVGYTAPNDNIGIFAGDPSAVQVGQGFLINIMSPQSGEPGYPNGTLTRSISFRKGTAGMQIHSSTTSLKRTEVSWPGITLLANNQRRTSSTIIAFNQRMTNGLDKSYDAGILSVSDFNIYTHLVSGDNETDFGIQCLPEDQYDSLTVPVGLDLPEAGEVTFKAAGVILPEGIYPVIEDRLLHVSVALKTERDSLTVHIDAPTWGIGRFYLHFADVSAMVGTNTQSEERRFTARFADQKITLFGVPEQGSRAWLYDVNGRKLGGEYRLISANQNVIPASGLANGIYLLNITGKTSSQTLKITVLNR